MNRIEQLIEEMCPDGVEYKELGEVAEYRRGSFPQPYGETKWYDGENSMPFVQVADVANNMRLVSETKQKISILAQPKSVFVPAETVVVTLQGSIGRVAITQYDSYVDRTLAIFEKYKIELNKKYFAYQLERKFGIEKEFARGSTIKTITKEELTKFPIPIPPLPIQQEIVTILDTFTALDGSLQAELEARRKQYEHYRNQLLNFEGKEVEWKTLEDCFEMRNGYTPSKSKPEFWENGTIPWFRMEDIRANGKILSKSIQQISKDAIKGGKLFPANSIIIATSATIGEHALITTEYLSNQRFTCFYPKKKYLENINMMYMYYYSFLLSEWCNNNTNVSGFASVDMTRFRKLLIPIPPLSEQERIVGILDKFDALLNTELPAEIAARRKQYEYYREKLLTFEPLAN